MEKSASLGNLAKALAIFQGKVTAVKKDSVNPFFKSKYASLGNIIDTIKGPLAECGLSYCQFPDGDESLTTILMHSDSGEYLQATYNIHAKQKDPQGMGSAVTYARRYALSALLGLNTDDDDDGNEATGNAAKPLTKSQQQSVRDACLALTNVRTVDALTTFKMSLPEFVVNDAQFREAGMGRYTEIMKDAKPQPVA